MEIFDSPNCLLQNQTLINLRQTVWVHVDPEGYLNSDISYIYRSFSIKFKICSKYTNSLLVLKFSKYWSKFEKVIKDDILISQ